MAQRKFTSEDRSEIFDKIKDLGFEYTEDFSDEDDDDLKYSLKLSENLYLVFVDSMYGTNELSIERILPDGVKVIYKKEITNLFIDGICARDVTIEEDFIRYGVWNLDDITQISGLKNIVKQRLGCYKAKYDNAHLLPLCLRDYIYVECIFKYFEGNEMIDTSHQLPQMQFLDLGVETI